MSFKDICNLPHRKAKHHLTFLNAEITEFVPPHLFSNLQKQKLHKSGFQIVSSDNQPSGQARDVEM